MALFGKNKYAMQKHSIIDVIKYEGSSDVLVWRYPTEDFNTNAQLIVGPSQEAVLVKGGQVLERFISGTYKLDSKNYPFIRALVGAVSGGVSPFSCAVYYINKVVSMGIDWGTDSPISIVDPIYRVPVDIRSYGDFSIRVENGKKLIEKLVGTSTGFTHQEVQRYFSNLMATQVRGVISATMLENQLSPIGIDAQLSNLSSIATERLKPIFEGYGLTLTHFTISSISAPELEEIKQKAREIQTHRMETDISVEDTQKKAQASAYEKRTMASASAFEIEELSTATASEKKKMAEAQAYENIQLNVTEQQKMVGRALESLAANPGPMIGGAGGMGFPGFVGGSIVEPSASHTADMARMLLNQPAPEQKPADESDGIMPGGAVMEEAPQQSGSDAKDFDERMRRLKFLKDNGMISQEQFDQTMARILSEM